MVVGGGVCGVMISNLRKYFFRMFSLGLVFIGHREDTFITNKIDTIWKKTGIGIKEK